MKRGNKKKEKERKRNAPLDFVASAFLDTLGQAYCQTDLKSLLHIFIIKNKSIKNKILSLRLLH